MKLNNYIQTLINSMSRSTGTKLTQRHLDILEFAYRYYDRHRVGPLYYILEKEIGVSKRELEELFPNGLSSVYSWVGIPIQSADMPPCKPIAALDVPEKRDVYLDHNSTTYIRPEIGRILSEYSAGNFEFANPSSSTIKGKRSYDSITTARTQIAHCLSVEPEEILFTGSGSESNNFAIKGIAFKYFEKQGHIITSQVEHHSVLNTIEYLEELGFSVTYIEPARDGSIFPDKVKRAFKKNTILVSIMVANNEIGTINPIGDIGALCQKKGVPLMVDAVQGFGKIPLHPKELGISLLSFSGHKIYAPKGIAGLYVDRDICLVPLIHGGGQEFEMRAGTENIGYIMALGLAAELAHAEMERENKRFQELREYFLEKLFSIENDFIINGPLGNRLVNNLSIGFRGIDTGAMVLSLDSIGISVSAGSACSSGKIETSHVLKAIKADTENFGTIRFSFGLRTTREDLEYLFTHLPSILEQIRKG